jgi:DNA-binding NarL/FixJ family response regulator
MVDLVEKYQKLLKEDKIRNHFNILVTKYKKRKWLLSPKETQIMDLLCEGRKINYIAKVLGNTNGTITHHLKRIYKKYDVYKIDTIHPMVYCVASYIKERLQEVE